MGLKTNKKSEIEFRDHRFLLDFLLDDAKRIAVQKCTQIGCSFSTLIKIVYKGSNKNLSIIYILPTASDVKDFVKTKFEPMINSSSTLQKQVEKDELSRRVVYSTLLKRIGGSHYFFKGSWVEHTAQSIDADILAFDELDFQKEGVRAMWEERVEGSSSENIIYWMGVPSLPKTGIAEIYDESDQREWWIECPHCKRRQTLEFPKSISFKKRTYICKYCREDLSDDVRRNGVWIAKIPGREIHGYHFNRLMAPWIPASKILEAYKKQKTKHFNNFTLGLPFLEESLRFQRLEFNTSCLDLSTVEFLKKTRRIMGIDQGNHFHIVGGLANQEVAVATKAQECENMEQLEGILKEFKPEIVVMDRFPDQHYARKLQQKYGKDKFLLVNQRMWGDSRKAETYLDFDRSHGIIGLDRVEGLDHMYDRIRSKEFGLRYLKNMPRLEEIFQHLQNIVPDYQERGGKTTKVYKKLAQDDFAHASNYFLIGSEILFPELKAEKMGTVPCAIAEDHVKGSEDWVKEDFERKMREISNTNDTIIIPSKNF